MSTRRSTARPTCWSSATASPGVRRRSRNRRTTPSGVHRSHRTLRGERGWTRAPGCWTPVEHRSPACTRLVSPVPCGGHLCPGGGNITEALVFGCLAGRGAARGGPEGAQTGAAVARPTSGGGAVRPRSRSSQRPLRCHRLPRPEPSDDLSSAAHATADARRVRLAPGRARRPVLTTTAGGSPHEYAERRTEHDPAGPGSIGL
jgi:hypothetical protein